MRLTYAGWRTLAKAPRWGLAVVGGLIAFYVIGFIVDENDGVSTAEAVVLGLLCLAVAWRASLTGVYEKDGSLTVVNMLRTRELRLDEVTAIDPGQDQPGRLQLVLAPDQKPVRILASAQWGRQRRKLRADIEELIRLHGGVL